MICLLVLLLLFKCATTKDVKSVATSEFDPARIEQAFERCFEVGAGTDFLTIMVDLPQRLPPDYRVYALILDEMKHPIRKISGFFHDPQLEDKNNIWFYFFVYAPGDWMKALPLYGRTYREGDYLGYESQYIKFLVLKGNDIVIEKIVDYKNIWRSQSEPRIYDLPSPPDQIPGYLVLSDYTFIAEGDYRKPEGYYVEGRIEGANGRWTHFIPLFDVQGKDSRPEELMLLGGRGWLELTTGQTHQMQEAVSPQEPYVQGAWDGKGYFYPDSVRVYGLRELK